MSENVENTVEKRGNRKERVGEVISAKMAKTIVVRVERRFPHPRFKKVVTAFSKFYAHDEKSEAKIGDDDRIGMVEQQRLRLLELARPVDVQVEPGEVASQRKSHRRFVFHQEDARDHIR